MSINKPALISISTKQRPVQEVIEDISFSVNISSKKDFVKSMLDVFTKPELLKWIENQGFWHVRMDMNLISPRLDNNFAQLLFFSVNAKMAVMDIAWNSVKCHSVTKYIKADSCSDGGSPNKLFYKYSHSLKQFILDSDVPIQHKSEIFHLMYDLFIGENRDGPGFANIQTFSGIPFFHVKPFSMT